jgi:outer membrane protein assembly factor BamA
MVLPIIDSEDGYGLRYGAQLAYPSVLGARSRLAFPLTWGGEKLAGAEIEQNFDKGPLTRVEFGTSFGRRTNPFYKLDDDRARVWARAEKAAGPLHLGGGAGWEHVSFGGATDTVRSIGGDVTVDTRLDPVLPRNAIYAVAGVERLQFGAGGASAAGGTTRTRLEARGYIGVVGQNIVVLRVVREDASRSLPPYLKPLLGGLSNLRGFEAGSFAGDTLVATSAELLIPLTSPLDIGKLGVSFFVDAGRVYDKGARLGDQPFKKGVGGSVWLTAPVLRINLAVAHGLGAGTRVNFGIGLAF